ncbi:MAG TPA: hypothetical protein VK665_04020 [Candidatus Elarobacter sp.]|nr:hypothetical protein [Candidatus Elarobacter sp.]
MKRLIACVSLVAAATTAAVPSTTTPAKSAAHPAATKTAAKTAPAKNGKKVAKAAPRCKVAPADEYFGKLKMSILGIRNTIKDQGLKVDYEPDKAAATFNAIALTEDAIHDWQRKYPCDGWIPGTLYALQHYYGKIHTDDGVKHVHATFAWLRHDFPKSSFVQLARREDGQASAAPPAPPVAAVPAGPASTPAPGVPASSASIVAPAAGQSLATPVPGTAPASVINAAGGATPAPH